MLPAPIASIVSTYEGHLLRYAMEPMILMDAQVLAVTTILLTTRGVYLNIIITQHSKRQCDRLNTQLNHNIMIFH